jgi:hypothetical protein
MDPLGERRDRRHRPYKPARRFTGDPADDPDGGQFYQIWRLLAVALDINDDVAEARPVSHKADSFHPMSALPWRRSRCGW